MYLMHYFHTKFPTIIKYITFFKTPNSRGLSNRPWSNVPDKPTHIHTLTHVLHYQIVQYDELRRISVIHESTHTETGGHQYSFNICDLDINQDELTRTFYEKSHACI